MLMNPWMVAALVSAAPASALLQDSRFPARVFDAGPTPESVETADFDGDGDMDVVIADSCIPQVRIAWNDGAGAFEETVDIATFDPIRNVLARDLDADGDVDIVAIESYVETHVLVYANHAGSFTLAQRILVDVNSSRPDLGDLALDGRPELVLCARTTSANSQHGFLVFPNTTGLLGSPSLHAIGGSSPVTDTEIADMNGDGALDVVGHSNGAMYHWLNDGQGALVLTGADGYPGVTRMFAAKIDEDDFADRVLLRVPTRDVIVFLTTQPEVFTLATYSEFPTEVRAADLDGDGRLDLRIAADELHDYLRVPGGGFVAAGSHAVPATSTRFASADFDGDGAVDAAAVSPVVDSLALVFASGASYSPATRIAAGPAVDQDFADIDQDGDLDVVRASPTGTRVLRNLAGELSPIGVELPGARHARFVDLIPGGSPEVVLFSPGSTILQVCAAANGLDYAPLPETFGTGVSGHSLAAGDLDGDGLMDLVVGNSAFVGTIGPIGIYRGHGDGSFEAPSVYYPMDDPIAVGLADFDGDGDLDVLAATDSPFGGPIHVLRNSGGILGGIEPIANEPSAGGRFAIGDVDLDGDVDIVAAASSAHELRVYTNDGAAQFVRTSTLPLAREVLSMQLGHLDGDGALDLVTIETSSPLHVPGQLVVHRKGDGSGGFEIETLHATSELGDRLVLGDITGDGDTDVLLVDATDPARDGVWVLENSGSATIGDAVCAGDGTATACPCGNAGGEGRGCANSFDPNGAVLGAAGNARVTSDSLTLMASGLPPTTLVHFLQSDVLENGGAGSTFGDGLLCVGGAIRRLAVRQASAGVAELGALGAQPSSVAQLGLVPATGGIRHYQARYRNVASYCTPATFNTTNAVRVVWGE